MNFYIKIIGIIIFVTTAVFAGSKEELICPAVNSYAIEKSAVHKKHSINKLIIDETTKLPIPYPYSMRMLLLSKKTLSSYITLTDEGIMSKEYYLDQYAQEQVLIHTMFKKRNSFEFFHVKLVDKTDEHLNNNRYGYVMYFDSSEIGELNIYLKENATNTTFLIWKDGKTKIGPILAVENILKSRQVPNLASTTKCLQEDNTTVVPEKSTIEIIKNIIITPIIESITPSKKKNEKENIQVNTKNNTEIVKKTNNINIEYKTKKIINSSKKIPVKKEKIPQSIQYNEFKKDKSGCFAYGPLNQCVVW